MRIYWIVGLLVSSALSVKAQKGFEILHQELTNVENTPAPVFPLPNSRQMLWNETEFYAFFHYGMNTYTNKEWGYGDEDEQLFAPSGAPAPYQWLKAVKAAGMRGGIAVVKHHDGFCNWPTSTTTHSVAKAGNAYGRATNIPRDFAKAAQKLGMKYGFYISPWDRNAESYGTPSYIDSVFFRQCAEVARYGNKQFEMWFDGANGGDGYYGGKGGSRSIDASIYYDMPNLRDSILHVCPNMVFWGLGGEARWIGNESGFAGETCWSMMNPGTHEKKGVNGEEDGVDWIAGESDAKFTDKGWFWHPGEKAMSGERAFQMYLETVGRNSTLIMNCPPDRSGRLPKATVDSLARMGELLKKRLSHDYARKARIEVSNCRKKGKNVNYAAENMLDNDKNSYWATCDGVDSAMVTLRWKKPIALRYVLLQEYLPLGQRVKEFYIETSQDGKEWKRRGEGIKTTTIGYKRIVPLNGSSSDSYSNAEKVCALRIHFVKAKSSLLIHTLRVY